MPIIICLKCGKNMVIDFEKDEDITNLAEISCGNCKMEHSIDVRVNIY